MCSVKFYRVFIVLLTRVVTFPSKSSFAYSFIVKVILAFFFYTLFVLVVINLIGGFYELSKSKNLSLVLNKFVFYEVLKSLFIVIHKGLFFLSYPSKISLEILSIDSY